MALAVTHLVLGFLPPSFW